MLNDYPVYATIATGDVAQARAFHEVVPRFGYDRCRSRWPTLIHRRRGIFQLGATG
jgi:hypothetical protein